MARVLTEETSLSRRQRALAVEARVLNRLVWLEGAVVAVLLAIGIARAAVDRDGAAFFWVGAVGVFLIVSHVMRSRTALRERENLAIGLRGELEVARALAAGLDNQHYVFNDIFVRSGFRRTQIDHLVVGPSALFLVETKNWSGRMTGEPGDRTWMQHPRSGRPPRTLPNPLLQCERQRVVLAGFLRSGGLDVPPLHSILVFTSPHASFERGTSEMPILAVDVLAGHLVQRANEGASLPDSVVDAILNRLRQCR